MANQINWGDQYCKSNWGDQSNKLAVPEFPEACYLIKMDCNTNSPLANANFPCRFQVEAITDGDSSIFFNSFTDPCKMVIVQNNAILYDTGWCGDNTAGNSTQSIIDAELTRRGLPPETFTGFDTRNKTLSIVKGSIQVYLYDIPQSGDSTAIFLMGCPI